MNLIIALFFTVFAQAQVFQPDSEFAPRVVNPFFKDNHPIVLIDQGHNELGAKDGRYAPLEALLKSDGFDLKKSNGKITPASLKGVRVFYVSAAQGEVVNGKVTSVFTDHEIAVVEKWVKQGGSLLLMADHAPIGNAIHAFAEKFGFKVSDGEVNDQKNFFPALSDASHLLFTRENHLIQDHPITNGKNPNQQLKKVVAYSGQAVKGPSGSKIILALAPSAYSYFSQDSSKVPLEADYSEAISARYGRGRIVVFGDGTVFTSKIQLKKKQNEGMNRTDTDNVQMATNTFRWLAGALD